MAKNKTRGCTKMSLFVDPELYRRLKSYAAFAGLTVTDLFNSLIEEGISDLRTVDVAEQRAA